MNDKINKINNNINKLEKEITNLNKKYYNILNLFSISIILILTKGVIDCSQKN